MTRSPISLFFITNRLASILILSGISFLVFTTAFLFRLSYNRIDYDLFISLLVFFVVGGFTMLYLGVLRLKMKYKKIILVFLICVTIPIVVGGALGAYFLMDSYLENYYCIKSGGIEYDEHLNGCTYEIMFDGEKRIMVP